MKKMNRLASVVVAILLIAGCTQESLVDEGVMQKSEPMPMGFNLKTNNMTRGNLQDDSLNHSDFGVWAYKTNGTINTVMKNYKVVWKGLTDGNTAWVYNGESNGTVTQTTKYWDDTYNQYLFYAYSPFSQAAKFDSIARMATVGDFEYVVKSDGKEPASTLLAGKAEVSKAAFGNDVSIAFNRFNCKVQVKIIESLGTGYTTRLLEGVTAKGVITRKAMGVTYGSGGWGWTTAVRDSADFNFDNANTVLSDGANGTILSNKYFCPPSDKTTGSQNDTLYFRIAYQTTDGTDLHVKCDTVKVAPEYTQWESGKVYTYIFNIGGLKPIKFSGLTVTPYTEGYHHEEEIKL